MTLLTLTPEAHDYAIATLVVGGLSCPWLAGIVHARYLGERPAAYLPTYAATMALVCAGALLVTDPGLRVPAPATVLASAALGLLGAGVVLWSESRVRRRSRRPYLGTSARPSPGRTGRSGQSHALVRPDTQGGQASRTSVLAWLVLVAVLEELIFRGVLLHLGLGLSWPGATVAVVLLTATFALTHIQFGWTEVVAKLPLSIVTTIIALITGTAAGAAVSHALVNTRAVRGPR